MNSLTRWRHLASGRAGVLATSLALAGALLSVGWIDNRATRRELLGLAQNHALALHATIAAAARVNATSAALAESQISARVRDNARLLAALDRERRLDAALVESVAQRNDLFRVMVFAADGSREFSTAPEGGGRGFGPGGRWQGAGGPGMHAGLGGGPGQGLGYGGPGGRPGGGPGPGASAMGLIPRVLAGEAEVVTDVHGDRRAGAGRMAAAVRRAGGGAILVNAEADAVLALQQQTSLDVLLADIVGPATGVAYVVVEEAEGRRAAGVLPAHLAETAPLPAPSTQLATRELDVEGRPVIEFAGRVSAGEGGTPALVRVGMRLDEVRHVERRFLLRQGTSLAVALGLGILGLGLVWMRTRYGVLSEAHRKAREALERRDRLAAMGELASTVAHEIRNPLNAIAMSAQRLEKEDFDEAGADAERRALVGVIRREADRINGRVQQFVTFARPPALRLTPVALGPWLERLAEALAPMAAMKSIEFHVDVARAGDAAIDGDQLRQAVDNLLRNAIEATPEGGRVELSAATSRGGHRILVRDSGAGIEPDALPRIFDLYFTTKREGTGVGLAVSQQIVTAHGGRIEVDSTPGDGAAFTIVLPVEA